MRCGVDAWLASVATAWPNIAASTRTPHAFRYIPLTVCLPSMARTVRRAGPPSTRGDARSSGASCEHHGVTQLYSAARRNFIPLSGEPYGRRMARHVLLHGDGKQPLSKEKPRFPGVFALRSTGLKTPRTDSSTRYAPDRAAPFRSRS